MSVSVWVDGRLSDGTGTAISALDHGLTVGDGVFETCLVRDGEAFALTRHLRRLERSASMLGLRTPPDGQIRTAVEQTLDAAELAGPGRLRITVTAGLGPLGSGRDGADPTLIVVAAPVAPWPAHNAAVTVPWTRNEKSAIAGAKTTSYAENVVAIEYAHHHGATEALFANTRGELCEGTGSNVLVVVGGELITPPLRSGCLAGITRELLLEWAAADGLRITEKDLPIEVLDDAEDVLLTSSTRGVQPLNAVNGREITTSETGWAAIKLFDSEAAQQIDP
jgi:branched-chain amino acid aminotransferase